MEDLNNKVDNGGATADGILPSGEFNQIASELQSPIESTGQTLSGADLEQLGDAMAAFAQGDSYFGNDTGTSVAYVVASVNTVHDGVGLFTGQHIRFRPANTSTSATPTLNAYGTGVKNIVAENGAAVAIGDLAITRDAELRYDGTDWRLLDRSKGLATGNAYPKGYINGFKYTNSGLSDISMAVGSCSDSIGTFNLDLGSVWLKDPAALWVAGNGGGSGTLTAISNKFLYIFAIGGSAATTEWGYDTSAIAANLLNRATTESGDTYDKYRHIGWIFTDGSTNPESFHILDGDPDVIHWDIPSRDVNSAVPSISAVGVSMHAPVGSIAIFALAWTIDSGSNATRYGLVTFTNQTDTAPSSSSNNIICIERSSEDNSVTQIFEVQVDTGGQIRTRFSVAKTLYSINTVGFRFDRGRG